MLKASVPCQLRVKHAMQFFQMTSELFDIDMYHHSAEISSFVQHFQFSASLELVTARYFKHPAFRNLLFFLNTVTGHHG